MFRICCLSVGLAIAATMLGCGSSTKQEQIEIKVTNDPLTRATTLLQRYANGQPLSSEVTSFPGMVEQLAKVDQAKADILKAGLAEIQAAAPGARAAKAKEILTKLQPAAK
jgi:hypothetical protein